MKNEKWPYEIAHKYIMKFNCQSRDEFFERARNGEFDSRVPKDPQAYYKRRKTWTSYEEFLGYDLTKNIRLRYLKNYPTYEELKKKIKPLKLKNGEEYEKWVRNNNLIGKVPLRPDRTYNGFGWEDSWGKFLGTETISNSKKIFSDYDYFLKFAKDNNIKSQDDWNQLTKKKDFPKNFPKDPESYYKKTGDWIDWYTVTGEYVSTSKREYPDYEIVVKYARDNDVKTLDDWNQLTKKKDFPKNFPKAPWNNYGEWTTFGDFSGTGRIASRVRFDEYLPPKEAKLIIRKLVQEYGLKTPNDWKKFAKAHKKLLEKLKIPSFPLRVYTKENEWRKINRKNNNSRK